MCYMQTTTRMPAVIIEECNCSQYLQSYNSRHFNYIFKQADILLHQLIVYDTTHFNTLKDYANFANIFDYVALLIRQHESCLCILVHMCEKLRLLSTIVSNDNSLNSKTLACYVFMKGTIDSNFNSDFLSFIYTQQSCWIFNE